jgi:putative FmdB family regulatory protein
LFHNDWLCQYVYVLKIYFEKLTEDCNEIILFNLKRAGLAISTCWCRIIGYYLRNFCFIMLEFEVTMPIYEYECTSCCNVFEVFQRMTENPLTACPDCSGSVKKLVSRSSFQLKGSGWYADGYSSKSSGGGGAASSDTATVPASKKTADSPSGSSTNTSNTETCTATP